MDCECNIPDGGYCARHDMMKSAHWVMLCRTKPRYWDAWCAGRGPGQMGRNGQQPAKRKKPRPAITGAGVALSRMLGCPARRWPDYAKMNELGERCVEHADELAASLVSTGCVRDEATARRMILHAVSMWKSTGVTPPLEKYQPSGG